MPVTGRLLSRLLRCAHVCCPAGGGARGCVGGCTRTGGGTRQKEREGLSRGPEARPSLALSCMLVKPVSVSAWELDRGRDWV